MGDKTGFLLQNTITSVSTMRKIEFTEAPFSKIYLQGHLILWSGIKLTCKKNKRKNKTPFFALWQG